MGHHIVAPTLVNSECLPRSHDEGNSFYRDGRPFRFIGGSMHYWRNKPEEWRPKLQSMRALGLNAVLTPTDWAWHQPVEGRFDFSGDRDLVRFVQTAAEVGLVVVRGDLNSR